jgi:hypothetical protein
MALMVWDATTLERRAATQLDIDELELVRTAYARILARFHEDRAILIEEVKGIRSRAGMPNDLMVDARPASEA